MTSRDYDHYISLSSNSEIKNNTTMSIVQSKIAIKLEEILKTRLEKKVTVQSYDKRDDMCICIERAAPADRLQFAILREEALKNGYEVEEDVDTKSVTDDDVDIPGEMYFYLLKPYSDSKSK